MVLNMNQCSKKISEAMGVYVEVDNWFGVRIFFVRKKRFHHRTLLPFPESRFFPLDFYDLITMDIQFWLWCRWLWLQDVSRLALSCRGHFT